MTKVLHVCETIKGGVATYLSTFDSLCHDCIMSRYIVPRDHADQLPTGSDVSLYERKKRGFAAVWNLTKATITAVRDFNPDVMIFHSTFSLGAMALLRAARTSGVYIYIPHGWARLRYADEPSKARIVSLLEGQLAGLSDLILNISKNDQSLAEAYGYRGRHIVVENGLVDLTQTPGPSPFEKVAGRINLLFVGRFDRQKGLDILLAAFALAQTRNPALHLHVVGASVLGTGSHKVNDHPAITFHSWVAPERVADYYANADMLVLPSRWEGLPMVLIEALRAGTPVMLSDTCGMGELIAPSEAGVAVPLEVASFAEALSGLSPNWLANIRPAARALFETRYGPDRFRAETLNALGLALRNGRTSLFDGIQK